MLNLYDEHSGRSADASNGELSFNTCLKAAMSPLSIGSLSLSRVCGGGIISPASIPRARLRTASSLKTLHSGRMNIVIADWGGAIREKCRAAAVCCHSSANPMLRIDGREGDSDDDLVGCAVSAAGAAAATTSLSLQGPLNAIAVYSSAEFGLEQLSLRAFNFLKSSATCTTLGAVLAPLQVEASSGGKVGFSIMGLGWKWDGAPVPVFGRNLISKSQLGGALIGTAGYDPDKAVDIIEALAGARAQRPFLSGVYSCRR